MLRREHVGRPREPLPRCRAAQGPCASGVALRRGSCVPAPRPAQSWNVDPEGQPEHRNEGAGRRVGRCWSVWRSRRGTLGLRRGRTMQQEGGTGDLWEAVIAHVHMSPAGGCGEVLARGLPPSAGMRGWHMPGPRWVLCSSPTHGAGCEGQGLPPELTPQLRLSLRFGVPFCRVGPLSLPWVPWRLQEAEPGQG